MRIDSISSSARDDCHETGCETFNKSSVCPISFVLSNELIIAVIGLTASRASLLARRNSSGEAAPGGNPEHSIKSHRAVNASFNSPVAFILKISSFMQKCLERLDLAVDGGKRGELILSGHEDNQFYQLKRLRDNRTLILSPDKLLHRLV